MTAESIQQDVATKDKYDLIVAEVQREYVGTRTKSSALLAWFLLDIFRIEPEFVDDAICDGGGDKGIDALLVDDDLAEITILQAKWRDTPVKMQGDNDLKNLAASASYFENEATVRGLIASSPNIQLHQLLIRQDVERKISEGKHTVRLVFVTNAELDRSASDYLKAMSTKFPAIDMWDRSRLFEVASRTRRPALRPEGVTLSSRIQVQKVALTENENFTLALVPATELVKLPGIADFTLFSRNVRLYAGRTKINRDIKMTVNDSSQHGLFPAYHNGMTLLTHGLEIKNSNEIQLTSVGVVNGCQSLYTLFQNAVDISESLAVVVKIVEVSEDSNASEDITYRSNNQNAVTLRDQRSNDSAIRDLKEATTEIFGDMFALEVRVGEKLTATNILDNALAAQLIMACYLEEPWAAVRKVRLFDQDFRRIFNKSVTPHRLYLLYLVDRAAESARANLRDDLKSSFASVRFTLTYLIFRFLKMNEIGGELVEHPEEWLPDRSEAVRDKLNAIADEVADSINFFIADELEESSNYDPKIAFKSKLSVGKLERAVIKDARRQSKRDDAYYFEVAK